MIRVLDSVAGALNAGGAQVTSTGSIVQLASAATRSLATALGGSAVLWLLDDAEDLLGAVASADQDPALSSLLARGLARARPSSAPGLLGRVVSTGAPVEVPKAAWKQIGEWDDPEALAQLEASGPVALCIVPVRARSKVLGALLLGRPGGRGAAPASERTLLQAVADQVGLAAAHDAQVSARVAAERLVLDATRRQAALVEHASDVIIVMTRDEVLLFANPASRSLFGDAWDEGQLLELQSFVHPGDRDRVQRHFVEAAEHPGSGPSIEFRVAHTDGSWRTVEAIGNNMIEDQAVNGFIVTLRDVTARREREERLRSNAGGQAALADLGRWALVGLAYRDLVEDAVGLLATQLEVDFVHVFEAMPDAAFVTLTASHGHSPSGPELLSTDPTSSPVSFALVTQETVICDDLAREARFEVPEFWTRSEAMSVVEAPIPGQDSPAGVLGVGCRSPRKFGDEEVNFVVAVANVLAAAAARSRAEDAIRNQALHDPLTGLPNRLVLADHSHTIAVPKPSEISGAKRTVLVLDIDRFKEINDTLGHALGDLVLVEVARRLSELGSPVEMVARLGADEFAVVVSSVPGPADADVMAARVLAALAPAIVVGGVRLRLRGSVGVAEAALDQNGASLGVPALLRRGGSRDAPGKG